MNFFDELKRRNVFRVGALYLVASWLILQVADVGAGVLGLPEWTLRLVTFLLALGFPLAVVFAWVFELTPEGVKLEKNVDRSQSISHHTGMKLNLVIIILMVIAVPLATLQILDKGGIWGVLIPAPELDAPEVASEPPRQARPPHDSLAVLPFVNMSNDPDNEYFSDGLTEELLNLLVGVQGLRVPSRTSSFAFKGQNADIRDIARQLEVAHILEGSVRKSGDRVRVTAQLIDVTTDTHVWSETYDRDLSDIFAIQDDIATRIVEALQISLSRDELPAQGAPTQNMQAYELYLQGLHLFQQRGEGLAKAAELLEESVAQDPGLARAWEALAATYAVIFNYLPVPREEAVPKARAAAEKALSLDPDLSLPQAVLASLESLPTGIAGQAPNWGASLDMFAEAVARHPRDSTLRLWYGLALLQLGYLEQARAQLEAAYRQDPAAGINNHWLAVSDFMSGHIDDAVSHLYRAIELGRVPAVEQLRTLYFHMGMYDRVLQKFRIDGGTQLQWWTALIDAKKNPEKVPGFFELTEQLRASWTLPYETPGLAELGKVDAFLAALRLDYQFDQSTLVVPWYPWNLEIRQAPGFKSLARDFGLVDVWRQRGWPDLCAPQGEDFTCN